MKRLTIISISTLVGSACAMAHISYTARDFGTFSPGNESVSKVLSGNISSTFGWAYATDDDFGDSHRTRAFRFNLSSPGQVMVSVERSGVGNILLPALSIYSGLSHLAPSALAHDGSSITQLYLSGLGGTQPKQGAFNALGDWSIGNSDVYHIPGDASSGVAIAASLKSFIYQGNIADGGIANYGIAAGIHGDGVADGFVSSSFFLPVGDYTLMVGGADYLAIPPAGPYTSYTANVTMSVVPEPSSSVLVMLSGLFAALRRRR